MIALLLQSYTYDCLFPTFTSGTWLIAVADASGISTENTVVTMQLLLIFLDFSGV